MDSSSHKAKEIFVELISNVPPEEWEDRLLEASAGDKDLLVRVKALLRAHVEPGSFLEKPAMADQPAATETQPLTERPGTRIGPYRLLQQIGEGGMGVVYMAEQTEPVERRVALKIVKPGMDTRQVIARFEAERQALAMMDHPNIAKILDAGTTETGRPYFVMELVRGRPITEYCDEHHLAPRERLELFAPVCRAVQHAHQKGVIHRDIKPSNVMVAEYDDLPVPKVIDFGVAKAVEHRLTKRTLFTHHGQIVGTVEYMSPEQAKLNQLDIDTRSDIYSLGVLLYELLTGETPFDRVRLRSAAFDELLRIIREEEPLRPSLRLSSSESLPSIAANRRIEPKRLSTMVRGDLDWIVMKALEKDRTRRYATASEFVDDILHYLNHEPVHARPPSAVYQFRKFARRNKVLFGTSSLVAAALLLGLIGMGWAIIRESNLRQAAVVARRDMEKQRDLARAEVEERRRQQYVSDMNRAQQAWEENDVNLALTLLEGLKPVGDETDLRGVEWHILRRLCEASADVLRRVPLSYCAHALAVSPLDGNMIVSLLDNSVQIVDHRAGKVRDSLRRADRVWFLSYVKFSPDGSTFVMPAENPQVTEIREWPSLRVVHELKGHESAVHAVAFSPDGRHLISASETGAIIVFNTNTGKLDFRDDSAHDTIVDSLDFHANPPRLASCSRNGKVRIWRWANTRIELEKEIHVQQPTVWAVRFSHDGHLLAIGGQHDIVLWDIEEGKCRRTLLGHTDELRTLEFSSSDSLLLSASRDKSVRLWDVMTGQLLETKKAHSSSTTAATFLNDQTVASVGFDGTLAVWNLQSQEHLNTFSTSIANAVFAQDSRYMYLLKRNPRAVVKVDRVGGRQEELAETQNASAIACSASGRLAIGDGDGCVKLYDPNTVDKFVLLPEQHEGAVRQVLFDHAGDRFISYGVDQCMKAWDTHTGQKLCQKDFAAQSKANGGNVGLVAFSPDGRRVAWSDGATGIQLLDLATEKDQQLRGPMKAVLDIEFSSDGALLASADWGGTVHVWDVMSSEAQMPKRSISHPLWTHTLAFAPDSKTLVVAEGDHTLRFWDVRTWEQKCRLACNRVLALRFSLDGRMLAARGGSSIELFRCD